MTENIMHTLYECIDKERLEKAGWTVIKETVHFDTYKGHYLKVINNETKSEIVLIQQAEIPIDLNKYIK